MAANLQKKDLVGGRAYHEETVKVPLAITCFILVLVAAPLVYWIVHINQEGAKATDVSQYNVLVQAVENNVRSVDAMLRNDADELAAINASAKKPVVTLVVPEVVIVEEKTEPGKQPPLTAELDGISWTKAKPLAIIDGETYQVGESVQGYEIVRIGKTAVQLQGADGTIVVMDMYEDLLKTEK